MRGEAVGTCSTHVPLPFPSIALEVTVPPSYCRLKKVSNLIFNRHDYLLLCSLIQLGSEKSNHHLLHASDMSHLIKTPEVQAHVPSRNTFYYSNMLKKTRDVYMKYFKNTVGK